MDPTTLATNTSAVTVAATDCLRGIASKATKALWAEIKKRLRRTSEPEVADLAPKKVIVADTINVQRDLNF